MACALTTTDNPYNPLKEFDKWFYTDIELGHDTCGLLDRFTPQINDLMSLEEVDQIMESAIDRIVSIDPLNLYIKVTDPNQTITTGVPE